MDIVSIAYLVGALVILWLILKILKWPIKLLVNGIIGVIILFIVNLLGASIGIHIDINVITALITGIFGIPGVIVLIIYYVFL